VGAGPIAPFSGVVFAAPGSAAAGKTGLKPIVFPPAAAMMRLRARSHLPQNGKITYFLLSDQKKINLKKLANRLHVCIKV
jgi:hypothetical protein